MKRKYVLWDEAVYFSVCFLTSTVPFSHWNTSFPIQRVLFQSIILNQSIDFYVLIPPPFFFSPFGWRAEAKCTNRRCEEGRDGGWRGGLLSMKLPSCCIGGKWSVTGERADGSWPGRTQGRLFFPLCPVPSSACHPIEVHLWWEGSLLSRMHLVEHPASFAWNLGIHWSAPKLTGSKTSYPEGALWALHGDGSLPISRCLPLAQVSWASWGLQKVTSICVGCVVCGEKLWEMIA